MVTLESSFLQDLVAKTIILVISGAIVAPIILILKKTGRLSWLYIISKVEIPKQLDKYHDNLSKSFLEQTHFWNLEGQQLKDLILPIHVSRSEADMGNDRLFLDEFIDSEFGKSEAVPRLVICGNAGSGKSVALRVISQLTRKLISGRNYQTVLLRFQDIKDVRHEEVLEKIVIDKFRKHQFEQGKRKGSAEKFVRNHLITGKIIMLLDGFDEVSAIQRNEIAKFLCSFFHTYQNIPFVMTSRKAAWENDKILFQELKPQLLWMSKLAPLEIKAFLWGWYFPLPKSTDQLYQLILEKRYLKTISRNPLMLNIIAYLYAQPNRTLPNDKVKFFKECVDALLEKWDESQAKRREELSPLDSNEKVKVLNHIAYTNLVKAEHQSLDFLEDDVLKLIDGLEIDPHFDNTEKRKILEDLIQNAELLVKTIPNHLGFPHLSLMEYFAANEAVQNQYEEQILHRYFNEPVNKEGLLAMLIGMDLEVGASDEIFNNLMKDYKLNGNTFVFAALSEAVVISPQISNQIIRLAQAQLLKGIDSNIATNLGHLAINDKRPEHEEVRKILLEAGESSDTYTTPEFYSLCMAVMDFNEEKVIEWTNKRFEGKIPREFIKTLASNAPQKASKILASMDIENLPVFLEGLREAGEFNVIFDLACNGKSERVILEAALILSNKFGKFDKGGAIKATIDKIDYDRIAPLDIQQKVEQTYESFGWPKSASRLGPLSEKSKKVFFALCHLLADRVSLSGKLVEELYVRVKANVANEMNYVIGAILHEKGIRFQTLALFGTKIPASSIGLRRLWKYRDWGLGAMVLQILLVGYALFEMMLGFRTGISNAAASTASICHFFYGWSFMLFITIDIAGLRMPKVVQLCYALFSPFWAFVIHNSSIFKDHWISKVGIPQCGFLAISAMIYGFLTWPTFGTTWVSGLPLLAIIVITVTILSSFLSSFSRLFPNERIRREISIPSPEIEAEDLQITMLLSHLMTMIVGTHKRRANSGPT